MRRGAFASFVAFAAVLADATGAAPNRVTAAEASQHVNEEVTVCGLVVGTHSAARTRGQPTFLDFEKAYPSELFRVVIWGEDRAKFKEPPEELYKAKRLCVTGRIQLYRGKPEIVAKQPAQLSPEQERANPLDSLSDFQAQAHAALAAWVKGSPDPVATWLAQGSDPWVTKGIVQINRQTGEKRLAPLAGDLGMIPAGLQTVGLGARDATQESSSDDTRTALRLSLAGLVGVAGCGFLMARRRHQMPRFRGIATSPRTVILVAWLLSIAVTSLYPPWNSVYEGHIYGPAPRQLIFSPRHNRETLDGRRLLVEWVGLTALAAAIAVLFQAVRPKNPSPD